MTNERKCPSCGKERVTWEQRKEIFPYGTEPEPLFLGCLVMVGKCPDCTFEFTDHRAEDAKDEAVARLLYRWQRKPDIINGKRKG